VDDNLFLTQELVKEADISIAERRKMWAFVECHDSELWHRCYPKIYSDYKPNEYYSPKEVSREIYGIAKKIEMDFVGESEKYEMLWAVQAVKYHVPTYWVGRDLAEAVRQTVPPIEFDFAANPLPLPSMTFMLPKGFLIHPEEGEASFISFAQHKIGVDTPSFIPYGPCTWASVNGAMTLMAKTNEYFHHWNIPYNAIPKVDLTKLDAMALRFDENSHSSGWLSSPTTTLADTAFGAKVAHMIFGLLVLLEARPDLLRHSVLEKKVAAKKGSDRPREFWSPAVIGGDYRLRRESVDHGGTHASPMSHWVRGHYREQAHGPKLSLHKRIWIEPFWKPGSAG
jgi:hypothetical protein